MTPAIQDRPSPNHDSRGEAIGGPPRIDMLVLHYTGMQSAEAALDRLCDPAAQVSSHYLVDEDGTIWRLVPEERRAWHAGVSFWRGETALNGVSIGVEIVNPGHEWGYRGFPEPQMRAVETLCQDIVARRRIPAHRVVGHSDIAPNPQERPRRVVRLAAPGARRGRAVARAGSASYAPPGRGVGIVERARALADLARIGYQVEPGNVGPPLAAFQRRFRPERWDGRLDGETSARLAEVAQLYDASVAALEASKRNRFRDYRRVN